MKTPQADDLRFAAEWLRAYDDSHDGGEQSTIANKVAEWLDAQADAKDLREAAFEHGVPVGKLRAKLRERELLRVRRGIETQGADVPKASQ